MNENLKNGLLTALSMVQIEEEKDWQGKIIYLIYDYYHETGGIEITKQEYEELKKFYESNTN